MSNESRQVKVCKVSEDLNETFVQETLSKFGDIENIIIISNPKLKQNQENLIWGYVTYKLPSQAAKALVDKDSFGTSFTISPCNQLGDNIGQRQTTAFGVTVKVIACRRHPCGHGYIKFQNVEDASYFACRMSQFDIVYGVNRTTVQAQLDKKNLENNCI